MCGEGVVVWVALVPFHVCTRCTLVCVLGAVVEGPDSPQVEPVVKAVGAGHKGPLGSLSVLDLLL